MGAQLNPTETFSTADFEPRPARRHRAGLVWTLVFQISTVIGIIALVALLVTVLNNAFGYVAIEYTVNPASLADGPLEDASKDDLVVILQQGVSAGLYRRLEADQPFVERSHANVLDLVYERVVAPMVVRQWTLLDSLFDKRAILRTAEAEYPDAEIVFQSWISAR